MQHIILLLVLFLTTFGTSRFARADQWLTIVVADCFALNGGAYDYDEHLSIRLFLSEVGGGQLSSDDVENGPKSISNLSTYPVSCEINGRVIRFETKDFRPSRMGGYCGLCEQTGFRLTADGETIWESPAPVVRGDPIFNGTLDIDRKMARVCRQYRPSDVGVELQLPAEVSDDWPPASITACRTYSYQSDRQQRA